MYWRQKRIGLYKRCLRQLAKLFSYLGSTCDWNGRATVLDDSSALCLGVCLIRLWTKNVSTIKSQQATNMFTKEISRSDDHLRHNRNEPSMYVDKWPKSPARKQVENILQLKLGIPASSAITQQAYRWWLRCFVICYCLVRQACQFLHTVMFKDTAKFSICLHTLMHMHMLACIHIRSQDWANLTLIPGGLVRCWNVK